MADTNYLNHLNNVAKDDVAGLRKSQENYGESWKKRGGRNTFYMLARKWDRLELQVAKHDDDIFKAIKSDLRSEGILDDIKDLRRYLMLVEAEARSWSVEHGQTIFKDCEFSNEKSAGFAISVNIPDQKVNIDTNFTPDPSSVEAVPPIPKPRNYGNQESRYHGLYTQDLIYGADVAKQTKAVEQSGLDVKKGEL